ncbi:MAG: hypothetical protein U0270_39965 [Labilithrix sp.]
MVSRPGVSQALAAALLVCSAGCKKPPPPAPNVVETAPAPDRLGRGEIPEGRDKAFALILPLSSHVQYRLKDAVEVESQLPPEQLSNFVRARVKTTKIAAGADGTTFEDAVVPAEPKRVLSIDIRPLRNGPMKSTMMVRDVTPRPAEPKASDEEAWRRAGRGTDGKPLDPKNMF